MPLLLDEARSGRAIETRAANCVSVGLINNMPDAALAATERQFANVISAASADTMVRLTLFSIPEVPRLGETRQQMAGRYRDVSELWDTPLDGLIVTGTEPRSENLRDEPYWATLARVVDWTTVNTTSTIWSCLAAHAAVLQRDGIERCPLPTKCSGIFECEEVGSHPMMKGAALPIRIPHSRCNGLSEPALKSCGYRIITRSAAAGVDIFVRQDRSMQLFLQGHPEYETDSLLREYRRDISRYLRGECQHYPNMPSGYFDQKATAMLDAFRERAGANRRADLIKQFPMPALEASLADTWRPTAVAVYKTWFEYLRGRKAERPASATPLRRAWRDWPTARVRRVAEGSAP